MPDYQLLNKKAHRDLRVATKYTAELGYNQCAAMVLNTELLAAQREYPIVFRKHGETGRFFPNVLLGFHPGENLFLDGKGHWCAEHIPLAVAKGPFMIGLQKVAGEQSSSVCIDMTDPRVCRGGEGEPLFQQDGSPSRYLAYISEILSLLHDANRSVIAMVDLFLELDLIEALTLDIGFDNGEALSFQGTCTIAEERLTALKSAELEKLHQSGFLAAAYYISGSLENIKKLIDLKNRQIQSKSDWEKCGVEQHAPL